MVTWWLACLPHRFRAGVLIYTSVNYVKIRLDTVIVLISIQTTDMTVALELNSVVEQRLNTRASEKTTAWYKSVWED